MLEELSGADAIRDRVGEPSVRDWIGERPSLLWRTLPGMERDRWVSYHSAELARVAEQPGAVTLYDPDIPVLFVAHELDWDRQLLGVELASLDAFLFPDAVDPHALQVGLEAACQHYRDRGWRLLVHKSSTADLTATTAIGRGGFDLLTVHLEFVFPTETAAEIDARLDPLEGITFGEATPDDEGALGELSARNHAMFDRFRIDPLIPQDRVADVYREWARNSVRGYADLVWVARRDGRPVGFGTWSSRERLSAHTGVRCAEYQLGAVEPAERNQGLFRRITSGALAQLAGRGETWGSGATNALNTPTQRCFQKLGAWVHAPILTYRRDLSR